MREEPFPTFRFFSTLSSKGRRVYEGVIFILFFNYRRRGPSNDGKEPHLFLVYLKGKMTYNDLLANGSVIEPSSDALWLPKRERGAKSVCLFVYFWFGLV